MASTYLVYTFWKPQKWILELICIVDVVRNREHDCCGVPTHNPILIIGTLPQKGQIYKHQTFVGLCCYRPHQILMKVSFIVEGGSGPGNRGSGSLPSLALGPWGSKQSEFHGLPRLPRKLGRAWTLPDRNCLAPCNCGLENAKRNARGRKKMTTFRLGEAVLKHQYFEFTESILETYGSHVALW